MIISPNGFYFGRLVGKSWCLKVSFKDMTKKAKNKKNRIALKIRCTKLLLEKCSKNSFSSEKNSIV
ncbi:hypothetical protein BpHYR1_031133 [Brachionus plicatilis]|uniref:Uncharacterized protein n=1 Tax=Brachionus plicatilis TaxID=10195 RepID=A0A3M7SJ54_BRAPC|nr:hypothetical protein BpHYR1_031133 [Brachionus plicatilis]